VSASAIAKRYAKALVDLGAGEGAVDRFQVALDGVDALFKANPELVAVLANPAYGLDAKREILKDLLLKLDVPATVANFLFLLQERNRLAVLGQIALAYGALADERSGVVRAKVTSAMPLADAQVEGIRKALATKTGKQVQVTVAVDQSLIGGVVTQVGDKVYDGSVKTQLARIEDTLQKG
jgi:F-type H+-transporting ATPase subunit delta